MDYADLVAAVEALDGELATIRHRHAPDRLYLAEIEYCSGGNVYLYWVDRRTLAAYAETLTRVSAADILSLEKSGIPVERLTTAYLGDDWRATLRDPEVFPHGAPDS